MEASKQRRTLEQQCNRQFYDLLHSKKRFRVHQGGTRSGKTHAICQFITYLLTSSPEPLTISIIRKTLPALKGSVMRDIISILEQTGIYWQGEHNKSSNEFSFNGHLIEFLSVDEPQKIRGRKRNIAFLNEANELTLEDFRQINMRTTDFVIMDFNPSDPVHWIYEEIIPREDCDTWITTYKDNKFLQADIIKEIERMRERDPDYWRVYGEGQQAVFSKRQIFNNWTFIPRSEFPPLKEIVLGIDFGFTTDPTAIVEVSKVNDKIYLNEVLYKREMTNQDIAQFLKDNNYQETLCFPDSAEPKSVEELRRQGIWAKEAIKGAGSVNAGISLLKEFDIYVSLESKNILKEYRGYTWTELKDGTIINKPVDKNNHAMDAIRYGVYSQYSKRTEFFVI
jgi:phage terminase large subunit